MRGDAESGEMPGEAVDKGEEGLEGDDGVDEAIEEAFGKHSVFFDQFGEVVQPRGYGEREEEEAQGEA